MALTAVPQSALRSGWEDEIVPSLRKRLEKESRILTQRMSAASTSDDESAGFEAYGRGSTSSYARANGDPRPSGIPRPSLQARSPDFAEPQPAYKRPRTYSQPFPYDAADAGGGGGSDSRSGSPASSTRPSEIKPTRIPQRTRSPSFASHTNGTHRPGTGTTAHGHGQPNGPSAADLWAPAADSPQPSPPAVTVPLRHQGSEILREQAPFGKHGSAASRDTLARTASRASDESEERPFEHWYRGDTARNGGVGELRVGRRQEMLEIANFGHALRDRPSFSRAHTPAGPYFADAAQPGGRRRAGSLGARESFYLDEDADGRHRSVLDETPLTDVEVDGSDADTLDGRGSDTEGEIIQNYAYTNHDAPAAGAGAAPFPAPAAPPASPAPPGPTPGPSRSPPPGARAPGTKAPRAKSPATSPNKSPRMLRNASAPLPSAPAAPSAPKKKPALRVQTPAAGARVGPRVRAKSSGAVPALATPTARVRPKGKAGGTPRKSAPSPRTPRPGEKHRSVGVYPALDGAGDDLADAIPTWTQPKVQGAWDDVVLPAVAKKKGMDEQYEQADGSPKPKPVQKAVEPAPGTFGFDYSKYKPPRDPQEEHIPMDEFGKQEPVPADAPPAPPPPPPEPTPLTPTKTQPSARRPMSPRSPSPLAFASYGDMAQQPQQPPPPQQQQQQLQPPPTTAVPPREPPSLPPQPRIEPPEEESGGCCKCVIM